MVILGAKSTVALQPCKGGDEECVGARLTLRIRSIGRLDSARSGHSGTAASETQLCVCTATPTGSATRLLREPRLTQTLHEMFEWLSVREWQETEGVLDRVVGVDL